jgi:hypothetical protein
MYNIEHIASSPGPRDAFRPRDGRPILRTLRRRRRRLRTEAVEPVPGRHLVALRDGRVDEALR